MTLNTRFHQAIPMNNFVQRDSREFRSVNCLLAIYFVFHYLQIKLISTVFKSMATLGDNEAVWRLRSNVRKRG